MLAEIRKPPTTHTQIEAKWVCLLKQLAAPYSVKIRLWVRGITKSSGATTAQSHFVTAGFEEILNVKKIRSDLANLPPFWKKKYKF